VYGNRFKSTNKEENSIKNTMWDFATDIVNVT